MYLNSLIRPCREHLYTKEINTIVDEVYNEARELINSVGPKNFTVSSGCSIPANAPHSMEATATAGRFIQEFKSIYQALVECLEKDLDACIAYTNHPLNRWKHIRTTNIIERRFKEVKRRVKVMEQLNIEESCISILFTLLQSQKEAWEDRPIKGFVIYIH
jgi:transposase-like protein